MTNEDANNWIFKAKNDLKVVEHELNLDESEVVTDAVCFHCQQAAEKYLKAFLINSDVEFGKTHNLELLKELCGKIDDDFYSLELGNLTFFSVEIRYPDYFYNPTIAEAKEAYKLAKEIEKVVSVKLK